MLPAIFSIVLGSVVQGRARGQVRDDEIIQLLLLLNYIDLIIVKGESPIRKIRLCSSRPTSSHYPNIPLKRSIDES